MAVWIVLNPIIRMFRLKNCILGQALMVNLFRFLTLFSSSQPRCGQRGPASPRPIAEGRLGGPSHGLTGPRCPHCTLGCQLTNNSSQLNGSYISMVHGSCPRHCAIAPNYGENMKTGNPAIFVTNYASIYPEFRQNISLQEYEQLSPIFTLSREAQSQYLKCHNQYKL